MTSLLMVTTVPITLHFLIPFARHYRARGWRVDALSSDLSSHPEYAGEFSRLWDVEWTRNPLNPQGIHRASRTVRRIVEREGYDLVHVHTPIAAFVTRYAVRGPGHRGDARLIYTAHGFHFHPGGNVLKNGVFLALEKLAGRWTDYLVVINREDEHAAQRWRIVPPERLVYMPGIGIDTEHYGQAAVSAAQAAEVRQELGVRPDDHLFLLIAEFIPRKRHRDALHAFARLARSDAHLVLAGTGPLLDTTQKLAAELDIGDRVHFVGLRGDIPVLLRAATALLLVSDREGLPRSVMESLSLEVPVIGTDIRGTRELLAEGCGILVPVGDVQRLTDAMAWVVNHDAEARAMGRRGREKVQERYSQSAILARHDELYAAALGGKCGADVAELGGPLP